MEKGEREKQILGAQEIPVLRNERSFTKAFLSLLLGLLVMIKTKIAVTCSGTY
jgi:hypothetical protein